jgi:hypothetical protein
MAHRTVGVRTSSSAAAGRLVRRWLAASKNRAGRASAPGSSQQPGAGRPAAAGETPALHGLMAVAGLSHQNLLRRWRVDPAAIESDVAVFIQERLRILRPTRTASRRSAEFRFFKRMIAFRKRHGLLRRRCFFDGRVNERGLADIAWHGCALGHRAAPSRQALLVSVRGHLSAVAGRHCRSGTRAARFRRTARGRAAHRGHARISLGQHLFTTQ